MKPLAAKGGKAAAVAAGATAAPKKAPVAKKQPAAPQAEPAAAAEPQQQRAPAAEAYAPEPAPAPAPAPKRLQQFLMEDDDSDGGMLPQPVAQPQQRAPPQQRPPPTATGKRQREEYDMPAPARRASCFLPRTSLSHRPAYSLPAHCFCSRFLRGVERVTLTL